MAALSTSSLGANHEGALDLRRKAQIVWARPTDHAQDVVVCRQQDFDLDKTIFSSLEGAIPRLVTKDRLNIEVFWKDAAAARITEAFASVPPAPSHDAALLEFMRTECNFSMEHADGSFMDHLRFCYEYSAANFKGHSPRVLLLHSIMGVGTNFFPMKVEKVPILQTLLTGDEFKQVEAFPSVLRLVLHSQIVDQMDAMSDQELQSLQGLSCRRVIDNQLITLGADSLWVALNYQLCHTLDFLPIANWSAADGDTFLTTFASLHRLLTRAGKLMAHVDFTLTDPASFSQSAAPPMSLGGIINRLVPSKMKLGMSRKAIQNFSNKIGHDLSFELLRAESRL